MRVIGGRARGTALAAVAPGLPLRPTLDRVREALFNILQPRLPGCRFLDLYAGSGANGIEALSRGAAAAVFADAHPKALELVKRNLAKTRLDGQARCTRLRLPEDLPRLADLGPFDIVYADPPRDNAPFAALLQHIAAGRLLAPEGVAVFEHAPGAALPETLEGLERYRLAAYGNTQLSFFTATPGVNADPRH